MTKCPYTNNGVIITAPGKFERCPVFAPHFWAIALEGFADRDDGRVYSFHLTREDLADKDNFGPELKHWLGRKRTLKMWEDSQGFVHCG